MTVNAVVTDTDITAAWGNSVSTDVNANTAALAGKQPLDSDLTAIAALSTTPYGRALLALADGAALANEAALKAALDSRYVAGVVAAQSVETYYQSTVPHTTPKDTGMTLTFAPLAGRRYRFTFITNPYAPGGVNSLSYDLYAGATLLRFWEMPDLSTTKPRAMTLQHTAILGALGSTVFKIQVSASNNTQIYDFGTTNEHRQFLIEDVGIN